MAQDIKIRGSADSPYRIVDRKIKKTLLQDDIEESRRYLDENLGRLAALSTIIEGNGKPLGVTSGQDVAARALDPHLLEETGRLPNKVGRISMQGLPLSVQKMAIIQEKARMLQAKGQEASPAAIMTAYNGEDQAKMKEKTGKDYIGWLSQALIDIALTPGNEEAKAMFGPLLEVNSRNRR